MAEEYEINALIMHTLEEYCKDPRAMKLIGELLQYELDIWNRKIKSAEIVDQYNVMVGKAVRDEQE
ncbi:MAG: hypothetical protein ABSB81_04900 [Halobacteriota archaeon]|jgi:hypothetical protein